MSDALSPRHPRARARRLFFLGMTVVLCVAAAVTAVIVIVGEGYTAAQVGFTSGSLLVFGLAAAAGTTLVDGSRSTWLGLLCLAVSLVGFVVAVVFVWSTPQEGGGDPELERAVGILVVMSLALADVCLLARPRDPDVRATRAVRWFTAGAALLLAGLLIGAILESVEDDTYMRWTGAAGVLWVLGAALVPLSRRLVRT